MEFYKVKRMKLKTKISFIDSVCLAYKKALIDQGGLIKETSKQNGELIAFVDKVLNFMEREQKIIIENDFIFRNDANWWMECYSKSNYYLKRKNAIDHFSYYLFS